MNSDSGQRKVPKQGTKLRAIYDWLKIHPEGLRWSEVRNYYLTLTPSANVKFAGMTTSNMLREVAIGMLRMGSNKTFYVLNTSKFEQQDYVNDMWERLESKLDEANLS